jgi:hypothetical protein
MDYPARVRPEPQPVVRVERPRQSLEAWVIDLCACRECRDGFVSMEMKGYDTLYACPLCDRSKRDLHPYQSIPSARKWVGKYSTYTDAEMALRKANRRDVVDSLRKGAARQPELQTADIGGMF